MPLRLGEGWTDRGSAGSWPLPGEPAFANSRALILLLRDLRRYLDEEIAGRSVLIAGHRGAGKTATVTQAWRILRNDQLRAATLPATPLGRRGRLQRPLLVKLVGESLIAEPPTLPPAEPAPPPGGQTGQPAATQPAGTAKPAPPPPPVAQRPATNKPAADKDGGPAENALVHITIALYRALAAEVAEGFAVHARAGPTSGRRERMEIAAQLALDLDGTPELASLRQYWDRLGRLSDGVLWPPEADHLLALPGLRGQGYREVTAVATAAQAFQVCSGAITYRETNVDSAKSESTVSATVDLKDLFSRIGALGAGALAGGAVGALNGTLSGIGTGVLVWLASGAVLSWSGSRSRKRERAVDYTFLRDRTVGTLDRDLPLVLARIREAGLAPVFMIDELDKLDDQSGTITALINRLKHLVSDYGFFCFLTDRNYFDAIEKRVDDEPYPVEHTYFGERLLIINRPQNLFDYVYGLLQSSEPGRDFRAAVVALALMFRSKLNFSDLSRELGHLLQPDGSVNIPDSTLMAPGRPRLEATIQLAINEVLAADGIVERFNTDLGFAQLAIDAVYEVVRCWQKDWNKEVDLGATELRKALLKRREMHRRKAAAQAAAGGDDAAKPETEKPPPISDPDLKELARMVERLAGYLADFDTLKAALSARPPTVSGTDEVPPGLLADIVMEHSKLLEPLGGGRYRFVLDETGRGPGAPPGLPPPPALPPSGPWPEPRFDSATPPPVSLETGPDGAAPPPVPSETGPESTGLPPPPTAFPPASGLLEAVSRLVTATRISLSDLVSCGLLPPTVGDRAFETTLADRDVARSDPSQTDARRRAEDGALALMQAFDSHGENLARALLILTAVLRDTQAQEPPAQVLAAIARYLTPGSNIILPPDLAVPVDEHALDGSPATILAFAEAYVAQTPSKKSTQFLFSEVALAAAWNRWRDMLLDFLRRGSAFFSATVLYEDILMAAYGLAPGCLFRSSLREMDQRDWSRAALAALPTEQGPPKAPYWLLPAALAALGFDRRDIERVSRQPPLNMAVVDLVPVPEIVSRAATGRPHGVLHVYPDGPGGTPPREIPEYKPMLSVGESAGPDYVSSLSWLMDHELFDEGRDETTE